ncbi:hypothetical protein G7Y79_00031g066260 [Physcia stellaris]|nr:hypothetical protein G7Y79_00031g066260 [Physcia stellaris]
MVLTGASPSQQPAIVATCIVSPIISSFFVTVRLWTRASITRNISWDDYAASATWPFCLAFSVLVALAGTEHGFGWHAADISEHGYVVHAQWVYRTSPLYIISLLGYKFSILLLYLRLFGVSIRFRYWTWAVMFFVFGYLFSNFITQFFGCTPIIKYWNSKVPGHCIIPIRAAFSYGTMNFVSDLFIFILPLPMVWRLKLSRRQKVGVTLVFMGGAVAFIAAAIRYGLLFYKLFYAEDKTWWAGKVTLCMVLEINTGLICSCTPALKPFVNHLRSTRSLRNTPLRGRSEPKDLSPDRSPEPDSRRSEFGDLLIVQKPEMLHMRALFGEV